MSDLFRFLSQYCENAEGATAIEYVLLAAGIGLAVVATVFTMGDELATFFGALQPYIQQMAARAG